VCSITLDEYDLGAFDPILITELMPNPDVLDDRDAEYIEITNMTDDTLNLDGLSLSADDGTPLLIGSRFILAPRQVLLFIVSTIAEENGGLTGFEDTFNLANAGDIVTISYRGTTIHSVAYSSDGPAGL
jgi:hypothetical protein